jgi:hypothetical protein
MAYILSCILVQRSVLNLNKVEVVTNNGEPELLVTLHALVSVTPGVTVVEFKGVLTVLDSLAPLASVLTLGTMSDGVGLSVVTSATLESLGKLPVLVAPLLASCHVHHPI